MGLMNLAFVQMVSFATIHDNRLAQFPFTTTTVKTQLSLMGLYSVFNASRVR